MWNLLRQLDIVDVPTCSKRAICASVSVSSSILVRINSSIWALSIFFTALPLVPSAWLLPACRHSHALTDSTRRVPSAGGAAVTVCNTDAATGTRHHPLCSCSSGSWRHNTACWHRVTIARGAGLLLPMRRRTPSAAPGWPMPWSRPRGGRQSRQSDVRGWRKTQGTPFGTHVPWGLAPARCQSTKTSREAWEDYDPCWRPNPLSALWCTTAVITVSPGFLCSNFCTSLRAISSPHHSCFARGPCHALSQSERARSYTPS